VPGLAAPARCPACGADVARPEGQATGTGRGGPADHMATVIIVTDSAGSLPGLALSLGADGALDLRQAPGDRHKSSACPDRASAIAGRLGMTGLPCRYASGSY